MNIHVEGNIGVGKSTFLRFIEKATDIKISQEPVNEWMDTNGTNLLEKFYNDIDRWSFAFQMNCFITRAHNVDHLPSDGINMIERSILSDRLFAMNCYKSGNMEKVEFDIYTRWSNWLRDRLCKKIDAIVYLRAKPETCHARIAKRARKSEDLIPIGYLRELHDLHEEWLMSPENKIPVFVIDTDNITYSEETAEELMSWIKNL